MAQTKEQKKKAVEELVDKLSRQKATVFVDIKGLKVKDVALLKKNLKSIDAQLKVVKKTLLGLACKEQNLPINPEELRGQIALALGFGDGLAVAKEVQKFSEIHPALQIVGGYIDSEMRVAQEVIAIAKLPSRDELLAKAVGSIAYPLSGLVNVLQGNIKGLVVALSAIKK